LIIDLFGCNRTRINRKNQNITGSTTGHNSPAMTTGGDVHLNILTVKAATEDERPKLSAEAEQIAISAAKGNENQKGFVIMVGWNHVQAGGKTLINGGDHREVARWRSAMQELAASGLIENQSETCDIVFLTNEGYHLVECKLAPGSREQESGSISTDSH